MKLKPAAEPISIFGGSHIKVPTQAILDNIASAIKIGIGLIFKIFVMINVTGTINIIVVTLSKNIDNTEVINDNQTNNIHVFQCVILAVLIAKYCKNPVFSNSATMIIIHNNNIIVLKSIDWSISSAE